jgi:hypothetical protein
MRPPSHQNKLGLVVYACHPSYKGGIGIRIAVQGRPCAKNKTLSEKLPESRKGWSQVAEHLPGKHKALSSNTSTAKKKRERQSAK